MDKKSSAARIEWMKKNSNFYGVRLMHSTDADIISWLDKQDSKQGAIKNAIRYYLQQQKQFAGDVTAAHTKSASMRRFLGRGAYWTLHTWGYDVPPQNHAEICAAANAMIDDWIDGHLSPDGEIDQHALAQYSQELWTMYREQGSIGGISPVYD